MAGAWKRRWVVGLLAAPICAAQVAARHHQAPAVDPALRPYASRTDSVRLPDGRKLHLVCSGHGSPAVILTAGAGDWGITWSGIQPAITGKTRVCAWDRAGFGLSSPPPKPQTIDQSTSDLQDALRLGGIKGLYVVVGHSLGGYESMLFKDREPSQVVGMVLIDPSIPDQDAIFRRVAPAIDSYMQTLDNPLGKLLAKCAAALRAGTVRRGALDPEGCLRGPQWPPQYPPELKAALDGNSAGAAPETIAAAMDNIAFFSSPGLLETDSRIVVRPGRNYGAMPLVVLTSSKFDVPPNFPEAAKAQLPARSDAWREGHDALAALSTRGINRVVPNATHYIQRDAPEAVIAAIDEVVDAARTKR